MKVDYHGLDMLNVNAFNDDKITPLVGIVTVLSLLSQFFFFGQSEVGSELLTWALLPFLFGSSITRVENPIPKNGFLQPTSSRTLWIVATGLASCTFYRAELGIIKAWPLLTPLLLAVQTYLFPESSPHESVQSTWTSSLFTKAWGAVVPAVFAISVLNGANLVPWMISLVAVAIMLLVFVALLARSPERLRFIPLIDDIEADIAPLSRRIIACLAAGLVVQTVVFGLTYGSLVSMSVMTLSKLGSWYFVIRLSRDTSWSIPTMIGTFSLLCGHPPSLQLSDVRVFTRLAAAMVTLSQMVFCLHFLPQRPKAISYLWALSLVPLTPFVINYFGHSSSFRLTPNKFDLDTQHPIELLAQNAKADFETMLRRQSTTYADAESEYKRRYNMDPPNGFKAWYDFAVANKSPIIDDFDIMYDSISPFWKISGEEVSKATKAFQVDKGSDVWRCSLSASQPVATCTHPFRSYDRHVTLLFSKLVAGLHLTIPDVTLMINHLDEPRVIIPPTSEHSTTSTDAPYNITLMSHSHIWDTVTKPCPSSAVNNIPQNKRDVDTFGLPFITDARSSRDLCQNRDFGHQHGFFMGPTSFSLVQGSVPVLSPGSISTMGDILFPSAAYIEKEFLYKEDRDVEWEAKRNELHWSGSASGGYASTGEWRLYHRQRFVELAQNLVERQHSYLRGAKGVVERLQSSFFDTKLYDVAFTRIYQCVLKYCREEFSYFKTHTWTDRDQALRSRLVFDTDGNGISGRYYKFLASKSTPLKQTVFREWHDDRLVPWLHYIPVSQSLDELPELVNFLVTNEKGHIVAREVATAGSEWFSQAFREVDFSVYLYRLVLEMARLQDPARPAS